MLLNFSGWRFWGKKLWHFCIWLVFPLRHMLLTAFVGKNKLPFWLASVLSWWLFSRWKCMSHFILVICWNILSPNKQMPIGNPLFFIGKPAYDENNVEEVWHLLCSTGRSEPSHGKKLTFVLILFHSDDSNHFFRLRESYICHILLPVLLRSLNLLTP